jgi:hypothetical protein
LRDLEDNWNRRGCRFGRQRRSGTPGRDDHVGLSANQISSQRGEPIELFIRKTVFDRYVFALDIASLFQALPKSAHTVYDYVW